ncbi:ribosome hibernation promotion factor [Mycolicibacterium pulveris]|uniref:ribosome hibernation promotion factor n=1 Tax=Mycolicibacterium pulveris TaxID=36813 RepID=UPI003CF11559
MSEKTDLQPDFGVDVMTRGQLPGAADYAKAKISGLGRFAHRPVRHANVKLTRHGDPAQERPVIAQANLDVDGRLIRAEAQGDTAREAIDRLDDRLRGRLRRAAEHWEARRAGRAARHGHEAPHVERPDHFPVPPEERQIVRRKSYTIAACTVDEAVMEMELLDYDFHLFTEKATEMASVIYRDGPSSYRLAQVAPVPKEQLAPFELPVTISATAPPCITVEQATERLGLLGLPFLFFIDAAQGRAGVLYRRYDGHYGLITPAG